MATVVVNSTGNAPRYSFFSASPALTKKSWLGLGGGWFFYSNNPETFDRSATADGKDGRWLNSANVKGEGQIYTWHSNHTGSTIVNCILVYNPNTFSVRITSNAFGLTNSSGYPPDSDAWLKFWNTINPVNVTIPANGYKSIFIQNVPHQNVFGIVARVNVTNSTTEAPADATLFDLAYFSDSSGAHTAAETDGSNRVRGLGATGYWAAINFDTITPKDTNGAYYTLASEDDSFNGEDLPYITDPSNQSSGLLLGNYGQQINITLPIQNDSSQERHYRIFVGSSGGNLFPCFNYKGVGYKYNTPGWGNCEPFYLLDILDVLVGPNSTISESFQLVVPAMSSTPLIVGARIL